MSLLEAVRMALYDEGLSVGIINYSVACCPTVEVGNCIVGLDHNLDITAYGPTGPIARRRNMVFDLADLNCFKDLAKFINSVH